MAGEPLLKLSRMTHMAIATDCGLQVMHVNDKNYDFGNSWPSVEAAMHSRHDRSSRYRADHGSHRKSARREEVEEGAERG